MLMTPLHQVSSAPTDLLPSGSGVFNFGNLLMYALAKAPNTSASHFRIPCWPAVNSSAPCDAEAQDASVHCTDEELHPGGFHSHLKLAFVTAPAIRQSLSAELSRVPCIRKLVTALAHRNSGRHFWRPAPRELVVHFRCGDVPFRGSTSGYRVPRLLFYERAIRRLGGADGALDGVVIVMCAASHATYQDQRVDEAACRIETCRRLAEQLREQLRRTFPLIGSVRLRDCEQTALDDWLSFFFARRLVSSGSTFSMLPGFYSDANDGRFIMAVPVDQREVLPPCVNSTIRGPAVPVFEVACAVPRSSANCSQDEATRLLLAQVNDSSCDQADRASCLATVASSRGGPRSHRRRLLQSSSAMHSQPAQKPPSSIGVCWLWALSPYANTSYTSTPYVQRNLLSNLFAALRAVRRFHPELGRCIFTGVSERDAQGGVHDIRGALASAAVGAVQLISLAVNLSTHEAPQRLDPRVYAMRAKAHALAAVPFEVTLMLDADTHMCPAPVNSLSAALRGSADAMPHDLGVRCHKTAGPRGCADACAAPCSEVERDYACMRCLTTCENSPPLPHVCEGNTGVLLVRRGAAVTALSSSWLDLYGTPTKGWHAQPSFHALQSRFPVSNIPLNLHLGKHEVYQGARSIAGRGYVLHRKVVAPTDSQVEVLCQSSLPQALDQKRARGVRSLANRSAVQPSARA